jgi:hypothetical protein
MADKVFGVVVMEVHDSHRIVGWGDDTGSSNC